MESSNEGYVVSFSKILLDQKTPYVIQILSAILSQDQKNKGSLLTVFEVVCFLLTLHVYDVITFLFIGESIDISTVYSNKIYSSEGALYCCIWSHTGLCGRDESSHRGVH